MLRPAVAKQLETVLENALIVAGSEVPIRTVAQSVIDQNKALIDELMEDWRLEYVTRLLRRKQEQMTREERTAQLILPGFERLPQQITVSQGRRKPLENATQRQLGQYLVVLRRRQRNNPRIGQIQTLMGLFAKWRKKLKSKAYGMTVAELMKREAGLT